MTAALAAQAEEIATVLSGLMRALAVYDASDPTVDLPLAQLRVCNILRDGARTLTSVSHELGTTLSAVTQVADRLERAGIIERVAEEDDRRMKCLCLTPRGETLMSARRTARITRIAQALNAVPEEQRGEMVMTLRLLLDASLRTRPREGTPATHTNHGLWTTGAGEGA